MLRIRAEDPLYLARRPGPHGQRRPSPSEAPTPSRVTLRGPRRFRFPRRPRRSHSPSAQAGRLTSRLDAPKFQRALYTSWGERPQQRRGPDRSRSRPSPFSARRHPDLMKNVAYGRGRLPYRPTIYDEKKSHRHVLPPRKNLSHRTY